MSLVSEPDLRQRERLKKLAQLEAVTATTNETAKAAVKEQRMLNIKLISEVQLLMRALNSKDITLDTLHKTDATSEDLD